MSKDKSIYEYYTKEGNMVNSTDKLCRYWLSIGTGINKIKYIMIVDTDTYLHHNIYIDKCKQNVKILIKNNDLDVIYRKENITNLELNIVLTKYDIPESVQTRVLKELEW